MTLEFILNTYKTERYKLYSDIRNNDKVSGVIGFNNYIEYFDHYLGFYTTVEDTEQLIDYAVKGVFKYKLKEYVHPHHKNWNDRGGIEKIRRKESDETLVNAICDRMDEFEKAIKTDDFEQLYDFIKSNKEGNFGGYESYDIALRIGIKYGIKPKELFLHKGIVMGLKLLETKGLVEEDASLKKTIAIKKLPKCLHDMEATYIEDFFNLKNREFMKL